MAAIPCTRARLQPFEGIGMGLVCVAQTFFSPASRTAQYAAALLIGFIVSVPLAPLILRLYRRRVVRLMGRGTNDSPQRPPASRATTVSDHAQRPLEVDTLWQASRHHAAQLAKSLKTVAIACAIVMVCLQLALRWQAAPGINQVNAEVVGAAIAWFLIGVLWWVLVLGLAWPIVVLGTANPRFGRWFLLITLPCLMLLLAMPLTNTVLAGDQLSGYVINIVLVLMMCVGLVPRHMRNVVPTLTLALSLLAIAWVEADNLARSVNTCLGWLPIHNRYEAWRAGTFVIVLLLCMLVAAGFGIYALLRAIALTYRKKWFSDAQLHMLFWYAVLAVPIAGMTYASQRGPNGPALALVIAVSIVPTALTYAWLMRRLPAPHQPPVTLLLLRVFGQTRRGEHLLDGLAASWRFIGPVCMIGGPDLAQASLEPHELAAFLTRRLNKSFVTDPASLEAALAQLDLRPDPDRRYRINEIYCGGEIWTSAARQLIERSDVVLIDLREFREGRHGTATELAMLANLGALSRTVAVVGKETDLAAVRTAVATAQTADSWLALNAVSVEDKFDGERFFVKVLEAAGLQRSQRIPDGAALPAAKAT